MKTRRRTLAIVALVLLFATACSNDDAPPNASTPDITAAPNTDPVEPEVPEPTVAPAEPTVEPDAPEPTVAPAEPTVEPDAPEPTVAPAEPTAEPVSPDDSEAIDPVGQSALEQLRRRMAAAAAFGGLVPTIAIVEELRRNAEGFSYEIGAHGGTLTVARSRWRRSPSPSPSTLRCPGTPDRRACLGICSRALPKPRG